VVENVAVFVNSNVGVDEPKLTVFHQAVSVFEVGAPAADRLDLGPAQGDAGLKFLQEKVIMRGRPIDRGVA
jgi:hypothetical protein